MAWTITLETPEGSTPAHTAWTLLRAHYGLTGAAMALELGVGRSYISQMDNGCALTIDRVVRWLDPRGIELTVAPGGRVTLRGDVCRHSSH